jgi:hypothetical protein
MARLGISDLESVKDPLQTWNWSLVLPNIPGSNFSRDLAIKCVSATIPGSSVEQVAVEAHGVKLNFAGRRQWSGTWTATFFETRDAKTREAFTGWLELMRSWTFNSGSYKSFYAVTAELALYDDLPQVVKSIRLRGLFPQSVDDVSLDQSSGVVTYSVIFSYDQAIDF